MVVYLSLFTIFGTNINMTESPFARAPYSGLVLKISERDEVQWLGPDYWHGPPEGHVGARVRRRAEAGACFTLCEAPNTFRSQAL